VLEIHLTNLTQFSSGLAFRVYQYQHLDPTQAGHYAVEQFWQDKAPINPDAPLPAFDNRIVASIPWTNRNTLSGVAWIYVAAPTQVSVVARPASGQFTVPLTPLSTTIFPLADLTDEIPYTFPRDPVVFSVGRGNFLDNTDMLLHGNYGVLYRYRIIASNPTQEKQQLNIYSRQAGGVSRAFVQINDQLMPIPTSAKYEKLLLLSRVLPPQSETIINLATMPQPGSNMPIDFLLESGGAVN
jgi:hypothetical protein